MTLAAYLRYILAELYLCETMPKIVSVFIFNSNYNFKNIFSSLSTKCKCKILKINERGVYLRCLFSYQKLFATGS